MVASAGAFWGLAMVAATAVGAPLGVAAVVVAVVAFSGAFGSLRSADEYFQQQANCQPALGGGTRAYPPASAVQSRRCTQTVPHPITSPPVFLPPPLPPHIAPLPPTDDLQSWVTETWSPAYAKTPERSRITRRFHHTPAITAPATPGQER